METTIRNASLRDLSTLLHEQRVRSLDVVAPSNKIRSENGYIYLDGTEAELTDDGVMPTEGKYAVSDVFDDGLSAKLDIPRAYLRRMRESRPDILDATVNGWLHGGAIGHRTSGLPEHTYPAYGKPLMLRLFRGDDGGTGFARALLSDRYGINDNLDILMAALDGVRAAGVEVHIPQGGADLTERRMHVRVVAPQVSVLAPELLANYRSPFDGGRSGTGRWMPDHLLHEAQSDRDTGQVFAGFAIRNSEVGAGAWKISPVIIFRTCGNGTTITADAMRSPHIGAKLDEGVIKWTADTERKALQLVTARTRDAVATWLDPVYLQSKVDAMNEDASTKINDAPAVIEFIAKKMLYSDVEQKSILDHFIAGGQTTAGGIMQAITATAQTVDDADEATRLEDSAIEALALAGRG